MADVQPRPPDDSARDPSERLDSWKEIAAYLKRDVTTVQRWEKKEGLPVHRLVHDSLGSVYAYRSELDAWRTRHEPRNAPPALEGTPISDDATRTRRWSIVLSLALAVVVVAAAWLAPGLAPAPTSAPAIHSLAVLPLRNLTGDASQEWLTDGMTEALSNTFARFGSLTVVSSTSTVRYKNSPKSIREIGRELGDVDAVVEGSVARSGDRIRVSLSVVHADTDRRLWTGAYERELADVLALYSEIALAAAQELSVAVSAVERGRLQVTHTPVPEAYEAYLRGAHLRTRSHEGGCRLAEQYLLRAIELDSQFAAPHAVLASCYVFPDRVGRPPSELLPKAKAAAERAIAMDARLGMAHYALGFLLMREAYDQRGAEAALRRAVEVEPGAGQPHVAWSEFLAVTGRTDEAIASMRRAVEISPYHLDHNVALGHLLVRVARPVDAIEQLRRVLELDANYNTAWLWIAEAHADRGEHGQAVEAYLRFLDLVVVPERAGKIRTLLSQTYAQSGWRAFWEREIEFASEENVRPGAVFQTRFDKYGGPGFVARRLTRLEAWDQVLDSLERGMAERHYLMPYVAIDPAFVPIRAHPRFRTLLERMGLLPS